MVMRIFVCFLVVLTINTVVFGQKIFDVEDFSNDYYGKVYLEKPNEISSKGWVAIYRKKNDKRLLLINSEELPNDLKDGKIKVNIKEIPYGEQSVIIYEDFNFDGVRDFAVMDGFNSCYHGPSFQIFLGGKIKDDFRLSKSFTRLAQAYCGMFGVDAKKKEVFTMTKSGAGWHQYSDFIIQNNKPKAVKIVEEYYAGLFFFIDSKILRNGRMTETQEKFLPNAEYIDVLLSFKLQNNKQVFLVNLGDTLTYNFVDETGKVELSLPYDAKKAQTNFFIDSKSNPQKLSFRNGNYEYAIYEKNNGEIGIQLKGKNFSSQLDGNISSKKGSLRNLVFEDLSNLAYTQ